MLCIFNVITGNVLLGLAKDSGPQFIEKVIHLCNVNWREKSFQVRFFL